MELLLNLIWLATSFALGGLLVASRHRQAAISRRLIHSMSTAWISYLLLVALLLPAISMTDDLMAMVAPADGEQIMRRYEVSTACQPRLNPHVAWFHRVTWFHSAREAVHFHFTFVCMGDVESLPPCRIFRFPQRNPVRDRAPPFAV